MTVATRGEVLNLRCVIEGEVVPCISATVTQQLHAPASAYIQVLGTSESIQLRPRSIIEVYTLQPNNRRGIEDISLIPAYYYDSAGRKISRGTMDVDLAPGAGKITLPDGTEIPLNQAEQELNYDLMFLGELTGYTFYEDSQSRTINLMCLDFSNHLDYIQQYTIDANNISWQAGLLKQRKLAGR